MTGRIREVSNASRLRLDMRTQREVMVSESLTMIAGRRAARPVPPESMPPPGSARSGMGYLLRSRAFWAGLAGRMAGQGQEDVVEGGLAPPPCRSTGM